MKFTDMKSDAELQVLSLKRLIAGFCV